MESFQIGQLIARAWADKAFMLRLLNDTSEALRECNIELPSEICVKVHMNSANEIHIVIPPPPGQLELSDAVADPDTGRGGCTLLCRGDNSW